MKKPHTTSSPNTQSTPAAHWPTPPTPPAGSPNIVLMMLDDVGFADFGCYGSEIDTPAIDAVASAGVRYSGFHTTAMCSTTRAALLTGRNHHAVGVGCLANFDSGYPGYRGKISADAPTLAETLRDVGYRNYMVGKWHVTPLTETGPTGPFNGWPLGRGFDRFYGFLDAETDQYSPELVRDNSHIAAPGNYETGYHLTEDLFDQAIGYVKGHIAVSPQIPWFMMVTPGACHAPHQAPKDLIDKYDNVFAKGWDATRVDRLARQIEQGIVPAGTVLPPRNDSVSAWDAHSEDERRVFSRLAGAYGAMLEHTDQQLGRLMAFLEQADLLDNTMVLLLSDNGASQEGGPNGFINAMGPYNLQPESMAQKLARLDDIGGPDSHSNFPWGWAMASNTPLKRYKQNTHGGGIRDPLVMSWPAKIPTDGSIRHQFCHVSDLNPTILELIKVKAPNTEGDGTHGTSFASSLTDANANTGKTTQYFEMFGHRGIVHNGWKAVAYHPPGSAFEDDVWELYNLDEDFNETHDLADANPERLAQMQAIWWQEAEANQVLPLDDRFAPRFAENAERHRGGRTHYTFWPGMGHLPSEVAPDLRSRSYSIGATVDLASTTEQGVIIAHGDATGGYSLYLENGHLIHDLNIGGNHQLLKSAHPLTPGRHELTLRMRRSKNPDNSVNGIATLLVDGSEVASMQTDFIFSLMISWSGLDVGFDRGTTVGNYASPFNFTGTLIKVTVDLDDDQDLDHEAVGHIEMAKE
ncbi:MAG: arylsulfatase A-like enzyme [Candidatus Azotimanducaceae bacterium]|jgi:arylsulfatase A-like enzyme|tara:strand:- start:2217 stop:4463 length:2247 start_codon:yes stop_codon:yes gene_type:complete